MVTARRITWAKRLTSKCFALLLARNRYTQCRALRLKDMHPLRQEVDYTIEK